MFGFIKSMKPDKGYGFISDGREFVFFHATALVDTEFDKLVQDYDWAKQTGTRIEVEYEVEFDERSGKNRCSWVQLKQEKGGVECAN